MKTLLLLLILLAGCTPAPAPRDIDTSQELVESLTYVKAKNGLCFGVTGTIRFGNGGVAQANLLVHVPCEGLILTQPLKD